MRNIIKKILRESDWDWVDNVPSIDVGFEMTNISGLRFSETYLKDEYLKGVMEPSFDDKIGISHNDKFIKILDIPNEEYVEVSLTGYNRTFFIPISDILNRI